MSEWVTIKWLWDRSDFIFLNISTFVNEVYATFSAYSNRQLKTEMNFFAQLLLPSNLWRKSCFSPNQLERKDFDPILCTSTRKDQLRTDCKFDSEEARKATTATLDHQLFVQIRGSLGRLCVGEGVSKKRESFSIVMQLLVVTITSKSQLHCCQSQPYWLDWYRYQNWMLLD